MEEGFKVPEFPFKPSKVEENPELVETPVEVVSLPTNKPEIPYKIPKWSGVTPTESYGFEVLKNGVIVDEVKNLEERPFWMFGRLPIGSGVNIQSLHPTTSRFHAVLQYKDPEQQEALNEVEGGWFIFDLGILKIFIGESDDTNFLF